MELAPGGVVMAFRHLAMEDADVTQKDSAYGAR
jgi:hypothetical protein